MLISASPTPVAKSSMSPYRCPISRKKNSPPAMLSTALPLLAGKALRPQTCNSCPTPTPPIWTLSLKKPRCSCSAMWSSPATASRMTAIPAQLPSGPRPTSRLPALATRPSLAPSLNSSFLTACAGAMSQARCSLRSTNTKPPGVRVPSSKAATGATVPLSRAATFQCPRSTAHKTCALKCRSFLSRWASRLRCSTTRWQAPAKTRLAPASAPWCSAPTGLRC